MGITIAPAVTPREISKVCELRYRIYVEELQIPTPEADHEWRWLRDPADEESLSFAAWKDGEAIGSLRITCLADLQDPQKILSRLCMHPALAAFGIDSICTTSRFMLDPRLRNGRVIYPLMKAVYDHAWARGVRLNYGDCSPHHLPFYQHMGFRNYDRGFNDPAYGYKLPLLMLMGDSTEFRRRRTPLARVSANYPEDHAVQKWYQSTYAGKEPAHTGAELRPGGLRRYAETYLQRPVSSACALFRGMSHADADQILDQSTVFRVCSGDRIARRGEPAKSTFILVAGKATSVRTDRHISIEPGQHFDQHDPFEQARHSETVIADGPSIVVSIPAEVFGKMRRRAPATAARLDKNLSQANAASRKEKRRLSAGMGA